MKENPTKRCTATRYTARVNADVGVIGDQAIDTEQHGASSESTSQRQTKPRKEVGSMKVQTKVIAVLAIMVTTGLACLAADLKTEAKADTKRQTVQIQADKVEYNPETKEITASGNAVVTNKDGSTVKGEKVVIKTDEYAIVVSGAPKIDLKPDGKK